MRAKLTLAPRFDADGIDFNVSDSKGLGLFASARERPISVHVEANRPLVDAEAIARRFFSASENAALTRVAAAAWMEAFYNC